MTTSEMLAAVRAVLTGDDDVARLALADAFEDGGDEATAAFLRKVELVGKKVVCPRCGPDGETYPNEHRWEDDEFGTCLCQDWRCDKCGEDAATVIYRPVCYHTYDGADGVFSCKKPVTDLCEGPPPAKPGRPQGRGSLTDVTVHYDGTLTGEEWNEVIRLLGRSMGESHKNWATQYVFSGHHYPGLRRAATRALLLTYLKTRPGMERVLLSSERTWEG